MDKRYPKDDVIQIIYDNHSAQKFKGVKNHLAILSEDRLVFVFTSTHVSWLNLIEDFFSKMGKQTLKEIRVNFKDELSERFYKYFDEVNQELVVSY